MAGGRGASASLEPGRDTLEVRLTAAGKDGLEVAKVYTFKRDSYVIDVALELNNKGTAPLSAYTYFQLTHDGKPQSSTNAVAETFGAQSFTGFATYTEERKFEKVAPSDLDRGKADHAAAGRQRLARLRAALFRVRLAAAARACGATT